MAITLKKLQEVNLLEIEKIKQILGIGFDEKQDAFKLSKPISTQDLVDLFFILREQIWSVRNVQEVVKELEEPPERSRLHYFGPGYPSEITGFISKMGFFNHDILIEDPMCFPISVKSTSPEHILRSPHLYLKHIFENGLLMVYLEKWVKVYGNRVVLNIGTGDQDILIDQIASIQVGMMGLMQIIIETSGGKKYRIPCHKKKEVREAIYNAQKSIGQGAVGGGVADEIGKLAELRDKGVVTQEEFEKKKKQILSL